MHILVHICCGPCGITVLQHLQEQGHDLTGLFFNPNIHPLAEYMKRREGAIETARRLNVPLLLADTLPRAEQDWNDPWLPRAMEHAASAPANIAASAPKAAAAPEPTAAAAAAPKAIAPAAPKAIAPAARAPQDFPPAADPAPWLRAVAGREKERCLFCWRLRLRKTAEIAGGRGFDGFTSSLLYSRYQKHETIRELGREIAASCNLAFVYEDYRVFWQKGITLSKEWGIYRQQYCGCLFSEYDRYRRDFSRLRDLTGAAFPAGGEH